MYAALMMPAIICNLDSKHGRSPTVTNILLFTCSSKEAYPTSKHNNTDESRKDSNMEKSRLLHPGLTISNAPPRYPSNAATVSLQHTSAGRPIRPAMQRAHSCTNTTRQIGCYAV